MDGIKQITKMTMDDLLDKYNVYTNKYDAQDQTNAVNNVAPQWWGDNERTLEINFETGLVNEIQETGEKVGMGYLDENAINSLKEEAEKKNKPKRDNTPVPDHTQYHNSGHARTAETAPKVEPGDPSTYYNGSYRDQSDVQSKITHKYDDQTLDVPNGTEVPIDSSQLSKEESTEGWLKRTGATVALTFESLVEGVGKFGESVVDAGAIVGTGIASIGTGIYDGGSALYHKFTGTMNEYESATSDMWDGTMGFVAKEHVKSKFDNYYYTPEGHRRMVNAYGGENIRKYGTGAGYVAGMVIAAIATMGIAGAGSAAAGAAGTGTEVAVVGTAAGTEVATVGTAAGTAVGTEVVTAGTAAAGSAAGGAAAGSGISFGTAISAISATSGFGQGTGDAWANGASLGRGLAAGGTKGVVDGLLAWVGTGVISSPVLSNVSKVLLNTGVGASGTVLSPIESAIGNNTSYEEEFEKAGGIKTVAVNAFITGLITALSVYSGGSSKTNNVENNTSTEVAPIESDPSGANGSASTEVVPQGTSANTTSGTGAGATAESATSATAGTTAAGASATTGTATTSTFSNEFFEEASKAVSRTGGAANLTDAQSQQIADALGVNVYDLFHLDRATYLNLMKKAHPDNGGSSNLVHILTKLFEYSNI